jgi:G:T-mismatch repair DNA endonuclease (very short patch repair protein)
MAKQLAKMNGTSKLEDKFEDMLKEIGEPYLKHYRFGNREYDFCLTGLNILIEVHGCYWHGCKECGITPKYGAQKRSVKNDKRKVKIVEASQDYTLLTFWEHDINKDPGKVIMELIQALG